MISQRKLQNSFAQVRRDIDFMKYDSWNQMRNLNVRVKEQSIRIKELERRLAQVERLSIREQVVGWE
ncbi:hypothetical protein GOV09_03655 [Candidatus Woesearchaeota archaeon]|nr:hypothetical protein [Candidatus Woesearchaeota archaeon]